ncbi:Alginate lyase [Bifidobacterium callimiconis]|uniref:Alginate lyase n=2 Tax=Bifidobacterium callimiconis TaxID=2306973 RepID=A0A430F9L9_9BIFI|nr:Alginate lyase [Bifidobacterium callimiconis]
MAAGAMMLAAGLTAAAVTSTTAYADTVDNVIKDNAWVWGSDAGNAHADGALIVKNDIDSYMRLDISGIRADAKSVTLNLSKKNAANTLKVQRASENLSKDGKDTDTAWNESNITWSTKPIASDTDAVSVDMESGNVSFGVDITKLVNDAKAAGDATMTLRLSTEGTTGSDLYSTRADGSLQPYVDAAYADDEKPVDFAVKTPFASYIANGETAQKIVNIRTDDGKYLTVNKNTGAITTVDSKDNAGLFVIYGYDYTASDYDGKGGAQQTTYAIKSLVNGKYLTIQNYGTEKNQPYYNMSGSAYEVKATADSVLWNERFYLSEYAKAGKIAIATHLNSLRDGAEGAQSPVQATDKGMTAVAGDHHVYKYAFEDASANLLEAHATVNGTSAVVQWAPVNGDADASHYSVQGATVTSADGVLSATVDGLKTGSRKITVNYANGNVKASDDVTVRVFNHPGVTLSEKQLDAMKEHVAKKEDPWYSDYLRLKNTAPDNTASADFVDTPQEGVGRGDQPGHGNIAYYEKASAAAYFNALEWVITGESKYADKTVEILSGWSDKLSILDGRDQILGASLSTDKLINAAEIVRYYDGGYSGYSTADFAKFQTLMLNVVYPVIQDGGAPMNANGNWDVIPINTMIAIGVVTDNAEIYDNAVNMYKSPYINGSIVNYVSDWGQTAESARDQAHGQLGVGAMGDICAIAEQQGDDLWSLENNKLAKAYNWAAQYNMFSGEGELKAQPIDNIFGRTDNWAKWSTMEEQGVYRGQLRPIYETALAHYSKVPGVDVTWMAKAAEASRPEGFVHYDNLNFDTLTSYNGEADTSKTGTTPYFQIRTRIAPWYQTAWNAIAQYGEIPEGSNSITGGVLPKNYTTETTDSYFTTQSDGTVKVAAKQKDATVYRLVTNSDETYSVQDATTGKYLSVGAKADDGTNPITATADKVGDNEKFTMTSWIGISYLSHDGRMVEQTVVGSDASCTTDNPDVTKCAPALRLGTAATPAAAADTKTTNWLQFTYHDAVSVPGDGDNGGNGSGDNGSGNNGGSDNSGSDNGSDNGNGSGNGGSNGSGNGAGSGNAGNGGAGSDNGATNGSGSGNGSSNGNGSNGSGVTGQQTGKPSANAVKTTNGNAKLSRTGASVAAVTVLAVIALAAGVTLTLRRKAK